MRKEILVIGVVLLALTVIGCSSTNFATSEIASLNVAPLAVKDYQILGAVKLTATEVYTVTALSINSDKTGSRVTYDLLLEEAKKLYADADEIINVRIDKLEENKHSPLDFLVGYTESVTYTGNALAVKYGNTVTGAAASNNSNDLGGGKSGGGGGLLGFLPFF